MEMLKQQMRGESDPMKFMDTEQRKSKMLFATIYAKDAREAEIKSRCARARWHRQGRMAANRRLTPPRTAATSRTCCRTGSCR